jgi:hypothetical protein
MYENDVVSCHSKRKRILNMMIIQDEIHKQHYCTRNLCKPTSMNVTKMSTKEGKQELNNLALY